MILQRRTRGLALIHSIWQIALAEVLFSLWACLPFDLVVDRRIASLTNYAIYAVLMAFALCWDWVRSASKRLPLLHLNSVETLRRSGRQVMTVLIVLACYLVASKDASVSRLFLSTFLGVLFVLLWVTNRFLPGLIARLVFSERHSERTLVMGEDARIEAIKSWLARKRAFGIDVVDFQPMQDPDLVEGHLLRSGARQLLLLGFPEASSEVERYTRLCERLGVRLLILNDWRDRLGRSLTVAEDEGLQFISFQNDVLECPINRVAKRAFDLIIAIPVCLFVLPPLAILVWILQRLQSPGSIFHSQRRTGAHGREFSMFKFRTMHFAPGTEAQQASCDDSRVFRAGRWLRKLSLDEVPQFLNVLRGEMSIVGPRPHLPVHDERFAESAATYRLRQMIKPGITGLAQVRGWRGETKTSLEVVRRVEADLDYLENWSLGMDSTIVLKTAWQVIRPPKNAY